MTQLKVIAVSTNRNSFGLRNMILVGGGQGWQAAANDLNIRELHTVLNVPEGQTVPTFLVKQSFELVRHIGPVRQK